MAAKVEFHNEASSKLKPDIRLSKENYEFDVTLEKWQLSANLSVNHKLLSSLKLDSRFEMSFRLVLADYATEFSASYTSNIFKFIKLLFNVGVIEKISESHILNFKATLTKSTEYKLGYIRAFLLDWHSKGISGVDNKVVELLASLRLSGNEKGKAVALGCPHSGAYTFDEQVAFINWYVEAYTENQISLGEYAFIMALQNTGARPIQLCYLYCGDLITRSENGSEHFDLALPNVKKRNQRIRESFQVKTDISEDLILVLKSMAEQSIRTVEANFGIKLRDEEKKNVPIFIDEVELINLSSFQELEKLTKSKPDLLCWRAYAVSKFIQRIARLCPLKTHRVILNGEAGDLHINPRRFRYTHATNMAILGASDLVIAEELGHEDTQNVKVYTEFNEEIADRLDDALASSLTPLAQAFSGMLIDSEKDAIRANDPRSRINMDDGNSLGNCGEFGFCANGTVHCYTCNKFQPWLNAPHQQVLDKVVSERDRKLKMGASELVLHGHNRSIDAIKVVIQKCKARKQEIEKEAAINV
ncbi:site-specific integrase [Idiomarina sp. HP20-50]|uniref:site-specific integrase n=1 Tax=Idiomarina sp. HP20-50 TaxID=3070813 RepID=UPI00294AD444|nr:site-specific integrase [Idiomarina sp. HP20-50]MDV6315914.1 site-specific integrase [Idiomarina sp. HP20-50]